jgi:hypothetical protein
MLPACYTVGTMIAYGWTRHLRRVIDAALPPVPADDTVRDLPLPGLQRTFLYAGSETLVFVGTQALVMLMMASAGAGWTSGASLAQRVCFSVNGFIIGPFASLLMLEVMRSTNGCRAFLRGALGTMASLTALSLVFNLAMPIAKAFVAGTKHAHTVEILSVLLPAYSLWMIPMGTNVVVCRVMFGARLESTYTFCTITSYVAANVCRVIGAYYFHNVVWGLMGGALAEMVCVAGLIAFTARRMTAAAVLQGGVA